jgi:hypothetical protein
MVYFFKITDCGIQLFIKGSSTALLADFFMIVDAFAADEMDFDAKKVRKVRDEMRNSKSQTYISALS